MHYFLADTTGNSLKAFTAKAKGNLAGTDEFKVAVYLRRINSEPYIEIISKTAIIQGAKQPIIK
jgi:hypothetical protein